MLAFWRSFEPPPGVTPAATAAARKALRALTRSDSPCNARIHVATACCHVVSFTFLGQRLDNRTPIISSALRTIAWRWSGKQFRCFAGCPWRDTPESFESRLNWRATDSFRVSLDFLQNISDHGRALGKVQLRPRNHVARHLFSSRDRDRVNRTRRRWRTQGFFRFFPAANETAVERPTRPARSRPSIWNAYGDLMDDREPRARKLMSPQARIDAREQTTRVAMQTLEEERRLRALKTERLRQARLEAQVNDDPGTSD